jgi:hypothetical protein
MGIINKGSENPWKIKAVERSLLLKSLRKELVRQWERANKWRQKSLEQAVTIIELTLIINSLSSTSAPVSAPCVSKDIEVSGYKFPLSVMWLSVILYVQGLSFRGVSHVWIFLSVFFGVKFPVPSYGTVRGWLLKLGLYMLQKGGKSVKKAGDLKERWALIVDESYSLGQSRLLVVLAIRLSCLKPGQPLSMRDVEPIEIRSGATWTGDQIAAVLVKATAKIEGTIDYVVSDRGGNLLNAYPKCSLLHIPDWSHYISNILENIYAENDDFKCFNDKMGKFKKKRKQSQFSQYSPPTLSVKMRFMNYIPFLEWANIMLTNFKKIPTEIVEELGFLQELKPFIKELTDVFFLGQQIGILLKKQGICPMTKQKTMEMTAILSKKYAKNPRVMTLIKAIDDYFETTLAIYIKCAKKEEAMPPLYKPIIASSEIIESIFGKFKHRSLKDPKRGFSAIALIIPLFCWKFSPFDVFKAMTTISTKDIEKWENENLTKKGYKSFRNVFKKKTKKRGTLKKAA